MNSDLGRVPPVISVVVLTFNSARYIRRCLDSLVAQTLSDFEVLVVDAGSRDETKTIVHSYDHRFHWLELPGSDMGMARNFGLRRSLGLYSAFLDSDDYYLPEKLARDAISLTQNPQADVTFCEAWHFRTERPHRMGLKKTCGRQWSLGDFLACHNRNLNTMCLRRNVWERGFTFGEGDRGRYGEEWRLQLSLALAGVPMLFRDEPLVVVEVRPDSHTAWSLQWIMKLQAIGELERAAVQLTDEQKTRYRFQDSLDLMRVKLLIALLVGGQPVPTETVINPIHSGWLKMRARGLYFVLRWMPASWTSGVLRRYWMLFQDRSLAWKSSTPDIVRPT